MKFVLKLVLGLNEHSPPFFSTSSSRGSLSHLCLAINLLPAMALSYMYRPLSMSIFSFGDLLEIRRGEKVQLVFSYSLDNSLFLAWFSLVT